MHNAADAGAIDAAASAPVVTPPPATEELTDAATTPPTAPSASDAGNAEPPVARCDGLGSYGLRATVDVTWDATAWSDVGRGVVELYGLVHVDAIDPVTRAATASYRACGLVLPTLTSSALCGGYQFQFADAIWDARQVPAQRIDGSYDCDAESCSLRFAPASYSLGIRLPDPLAPWPDVKDTTTAQFSDDDADGFPGVSADVASAAGVPSPNACTAMTPTMPGPGNQGPANPRPGASVPPIQLGQLLLGLRTQLTAAMQLSPTCELEQSAASDPAIELRAAGCFVAEGMDPTTAMLSCNEELRANYDTALPGFSALEPGATPKRAGPGSERQEPSVGPVLKAVRFGSNEAVSCDQVRGRLR